MKILLLTFISLYSLTLLSQNEQESLGSESPLKIIAKYHEGDILLRWGPSTEGHWINGINAGYQIRRQEIGSNATSREKSVIVASLKPWSFEKFKEAINSEQSTDELHLTGESIYGEWQTMSKKTKGLKNWGMRSDELKSKYLIAMLSSDLNFTAAQAGGLAYRDTTVEEGKSYAYYIDIVGYHQYRTSVEVINTNDQEVEPPVRLEGNYEGELQIDLAWSRQIYSQHYTAYHIEVSEDNKQFTRLTQIPYIHTITDSKVVQDDQIIYTHRLDNNYKPLYYRIIGINSFGLLSKPSESVKLMGRDRTPPPPPNIDTLLSDPMMAAIGINWDYPERANDLSFTRIKRSTHATGVYVDLVDLPPSQLSYRDPIDGQHLRYYYKLCAVDTARNEACTGGRLGVINDRIPPDQPTGLRGTIDSSGIVMLDWNDNPESDVRGYYIQLANGKKRVFTSLVDRPWNESKFIDTLNLNSLTEEVYYRVRAIDYNQNLGEYSEVVRLVKPDTIPPSASVIKKYIAKENYIKLDYVLSASHDATQFTLQRKDKNSTWSQIAQLGLDSATYLDSTVLSNTFYSYRIVTHDDAYNQSTDLLEVSVKSADIRHTLIPSLSLSKKDDKVILTWENNLPKNTEIKIYKGSTEKRLLSYRKLLDQAMFADDSNSNSYYRVKFYFSDGSHSQYSNIVNLVGNE